MAALIAVVVATMLVSFLCSMSEAALYSAPPSHIEALRQRGSTRAARFARLRERVERPITAILTLNTFANTMGAAIAGALVGELYEQKWVLPFSLALTLGMLLFAEIVPKSLGVAYSRVAAPWLAWPIQWMVWALYPLVRAGETLTALLSPPRADEGPSEDEIIALASLGAAGGAISPKEAHWVRHVLRLNDVTAAAIMTPRPVMRTLDGAKTIGELGPELLTLNFSRIPVVTDEGPDFITGVALRRKLVNAYLEGRREAKVADLQESAQFVPATMRGHQLLHFFIEHKMHLAVVVDEYGGTMGLVTLEDVIEAMLGEEIVGEFDPHPDLRQFARERAAARFKRQPGGDR